MASYNVAVLIPCYNEEAAVAGVVTSFRSALPNATIYVYDNNSSDATASRAKAAGAIVRKEPRQGKGNVVRRMFADIDADIYVLADGDGACDPSSAPKMIELLLAGQHDMVTGSRVPASEHVYRPGHLVGNKVLTGLVAVFFGNRVADVLSGYRVLSKRFVKTFPILSSGFEIETEMTIHALEMQMKICECDTAFLERAQGTESKLHTIKDGLRILRTIALLVKEERPLPFFTALSGLCALVSIVLAVPVILTFLETSLITRVPTLLLSVGLMILAFQSVSSGLFLDGVTRSRREVKRLHYLSYQALGDPAECV